MKRRALFLALAVLLFTQQASAATTDCDQWVGGPWTVVFGGSTKTPAGTYEMISYIRQLPAGTDTYFTALGGNWDCAIGFKRRKSDNSTQVPSNYVSVIMGRRSGTAGPYYFYDGCTRDRPAKLLEDCIGVPYSSATLGSMPSNSVTFTQSTAKMVSGVKTPLLKGDYTDIQNTTWKFTYDAAYDRTPGDDWGNITGDYNIVFGPAVFDYNPPGAPDFIVFPWYIDGLRSDGRKVSMFEFTGMPYYTEWDSAGVANNGPYCTKPYGGLFKEAYYAWGSYYPVGFTSPTTPSTYGLMSATKICVDADGDTYGVGCSAGPDCDDANSAVHPGATEVCNGIDDNCNGTTDEGCAAWYRDADGDTYGNAAVTSESVGQPSGYVANSTDCNDANSAVHPVDPDVTAPSGAGIAPLPAFTWQNKSPGTVPWYEVSVYSATAGKYVANEWFEAASVCSGGSCTTHLSAALPPGTFYWWLNTYGATSCGLKIQPGGKYQQFTVAGCAGPALTAPTGTVAFGTRPAHTFTSSAEWVDLQIYSSTLGAVSSQWVAATSACTMGSCSVTPVRWIMALGQNWWWVNTWSAACGYQFQPDLNLGSYTVE